MLVICEQTKIVKNTWSYDVYNDVSLTHAMKIRNGFPNWFSSVYHPMNIPFYASFTPCSTLLRNDADTTLDHHFVFEQILHQDIYCKYKP